MIEVTSPITASVTSPVTSLGGTEYFYNLLQEDGFALLQEDNSLVVLE